MGCSNKEMIFRSSDFQKNIKQWKLERKTFTKFWWQSALDELLELAIIWQILIASASKDNPLDCIIQELQALS